MIIENEREIEKQINKVIWTGRESERERKREKDGEREKY